MSFKIPDFAQINSLEQIIAFMRNVFLRTSRTDIVVSREIPLPGWNMVTTPSIVIPLPADLTINDGWKRITGIDLMIFDDALTEKNDPSLITGSFDIGKVDPNDITIGRVTSGFFDSTAYDDDTIRRGTLILWHTV